MAEGSEREVASGIGLCHVLHGAINILFLTIPDIGTMSCLHGFSSKPISQWIYLAFSLFSQSMNAGHRGESGEV